MFIITQSHARVECPHCHAMLGVTAKDVQIDYIGVTPYYLWIRCMLCNGLVDLDGKIDAIKHELKEPH